MLCKSFVLTWTKIRVLLVTRSWSIAHLTADVLCLSRSTATIVGFPSCWIWWDAIFSSMYYVLVISWKSHIFHRALLSLSSLDRVLGERIEKKNISNSWFYYGTTHDVHTVIATFFPWVFRWKTKKEGTKLCLFLSFVSLDYNFSSYCIYV